MGNTPSVKIIVATHKKYDMPKDSMYVPLHLGAEGKTDAAGNPLDLGYRKDNEGDNISAKNFCFGSQTGLYWMWKHMDADYLGLVHYRRYFVEKKVDREHPLDSILTEKTLAGMLGQYRVFVPRKRHYYIESIYSHYAHTLDGSQLDVTREIIRELHPDCIDAFDRFMRSRSAYIFNMMILEKDLMHDYCAWLFSILFELEKRIGFEGKTDFEKRYCGRISERLFNVWLLRQLDTGRLRPDQIKELPYTEEVNWSRKIRSFLAAKVAHKKYGKSF